MYTGMKQRHRAKPHIKETARRRIQRLFSLAEETQDMKRAQRYAYLARLVAMKAKCRIMPEYRRRLCRHCHAYLVPGRNARVRVNRATVSYYCANCRRFTRYKKR